MIWEGMSLLEQAKATCFCHRRTVLFCILVSIWMRVFAGLVQGLILIQGFGCGRGANERPRQAGVGGGRGETRMRRERATEAAENKLEASCSHAEMRWRCAIVR
ncbi:uncharacterized protein GLRG_02597 [Colletotrichum graminicola M1.001]|uniref:Uncharacterized protein n=1 Tax=Colletotrichum graminicola (strain M1.001 / M2 / FGSC 10212) TaxID=645133 RepID=E3Q7D9_COLGM|nr:uncharacterized protein GLRG_02597 [Colletotrichum graminicola M1.001]EFQ26777.1 hypothetical protein GLRG_02597 [Colletotrichum graminicola M1.001]